MFAIYKMNKTNPSHNIVPFRQNVDDMSKYYPKAKKIEKDVEKNYPLADGNNRYECILQKYKDDSSRSKMLLKIFCDGRCIFIITLCSLFDLKCVVTVNVALHGENGQNLVSFGLGDKKRFVHKRYDSNFNNTKPEHHRQTTTNLVNSIMKFCYKATQYIGRNEFHQSYINTDDGERLHLTTDEKELFLADDSALLQKVKSHFSLINKYGGFRKNYKSILVSTPKLTDAEIDNKWKIVYKPPPLFAPRMQNTVELSELKNSMNDEQYQKHVGRKRPKNSALVESVTGYVRTL
jgi:hypothetical protein